MLAATPGTSDKNVISNGIAASHAYTLLNAYTVKFSNGTEKAKLFLMRNPWGSDGNYNGSWSDLDPIWKDTTNNFKGQVPFINNTKDGLFFISVQDFYNCFSMFSVSYQSDSFKNSIFTVYNDTGNWTQFNFNIPTT
jgi:Calpain family cysteine protease